MIRKLTLALVAVAPLLVLAAPKPTPPPAGDEAGPAPLEGGAKAEENGKATVAPPDTYTVRPGDTLWDLSGRFLNNPWYWPKIWSYNPDIANPHWINTGDNLRFYPSGDEGAMQVVPVAEAEPEPEAEAAPVKELEDLSRADLKEGPTDEEREVVSVAGAHVVGYVPPHTMYARRDAFVTRHELEESGTITASFEEKTLLSIRDHAYVTFKNPGGIQVGNTFSIFRTLREVEHPVTGETLGFQTVILGSGKVTAVDKRGVTVFIASSYDTIERGDRLGPWVEKAYRPVPPKANGKKLEGYIVGSPVEQLGELAESQFVFVDKGKADGVEEGNSFTVIRSGDPRMSGDLLHPEHWEGDPLPIEDLGRLLVVDVKDHTSAALVTRSLRELLPGDRVEMRVAEK